MRFSLILFSSALIRRVLTPPFLYPFLRIVHRPNNRRLHCFHGNTGKEALHAFPVLPHPFLELALLLFLILPLIPEKRKKIGPQTFSQGSFLPKTFYCFSVDGREKDCASVTVTEKMKREYSHLCQVMVLFHFLW